MDKLNLVVSLVVSFIAVGISVFNLIATRKQLFADVVSKHRIDDVEALRNLICQFVSLYLKSASRNDLLSVKINVDLYLNERYNPAHVKLAEVMLELANTPEKDVERLVSIAKISLQERYLRSKLEVSYLPHKKAQYRRKIQECMDEAEKL